MFLEKVVERRMMFEQLLNEYVMFQQNQLAEKTSFLENEAVKKQNDSLLQKSKVMAQIHQIDQDLYNQVQSNSSIPEQNINSNNNDYANLTQRNFQNDIEVALRESQVNYKTPLQQEINQQQQFKSSNIQQSDILLTETKIKRDLNKIRNKLLLEEKQDFKHLQKSFNNVVNQDMTLSQLEEKNKQKKLYTVDNNVEQESEDEQQVVKRSVKKSITNSQVDDIVKKSISREQQTTRSYVQQSKLSNCDNIRKTQTLSQVQQYKDVQSSLTQESQNYLKWMKGDQ